jgi:hypothetical protein
VQKDGVTYLNPDVLLNSFLGNLTLIGQMFLNLKFNPTFSSEIKNMGIRNLSMVTGDKDRTYPKFYQTFHRFYKSNNPKLSALQLDTKIKDEYVKLSQKFFYNQNFDGPLFNGNFPYEHDIIRIYNDYLAFEAKGKIGIQALIKSSFLKYYTQFVDSDKDVSKMIDQIRDNVIKISGLDFLLEYVNPTNGLLYQKYLGQQHWFLIKELESAYLELINEAVYLMGDSQVKRNQIGDMSVNTKKHYYLGKMMCESWSKLNDLDISGADSFTLILDKITAIKIKISALQLPKLHLIWKFVGIGLRPNNKPNPVTIIKTNFVPPVFKATHKKAIIFKGNVTYDAGESKNIKLPTKEEQDLNQYFNELKFVPKIKDILTSLGTIGYLPDLKKTVAEMRNIVENRGIDVQVCGQDAVSNPHKDINDMIDPNEFAADRIRMLNLKKYVISNLRFYMQLFSRINRDQLKQYGLQYKYNNLMKNNDFNDTFTNFKTELTSNQILDYINSNLDNPKNWKTVNNVLLFTLVHDISRHLRTLRLDATKFDKKKKSATKGLSKYDIYQQFVKNLFEEIDFDQQVNNVPFNHRETNQALFGKIIADAQAQVKGGKDALEWGILKFKLNVRDTQEQQDANGPNLDQNVATSPDTDIDDAMEMDFDLGDDGNDYSD